MSARYRILPQHSTTCLDDLVDGAAPHRFAMARGCVAFIKHLLKGLFKRVGVNGGFWFEEGVLEEVGDGEALLRLP